MLSRFFPISPSLAAFLVAVIAIGSGIVDRLTSIAVDLWAFWDQYSDDHCEFCDDEEEEDDIFNKEKKAETKGIASCPSCHEKLVEYDGDYLHQKEVDRRPWRLTIGRNDPCPCGSGEKYKKCCKAHPIFQTPN